MTSKLSGRVTDETTGLPIKEVYIDLYSQTGVYGTSTDENGFYSLTVPSTAYTLVADKLGYRRHEQAIDLSTPGEYTKNISLTPVPLYTLTVDSEPIKVKFTISNAFPESYTTPYSDKFEEGTALKIWMPTSVVDQTTGYGYGFRSMDYDGSTTTEPYLKITMDKDKTVIAHYNLVQTETRKLTVRSVPIPTSVLIDEKEEGNTPIEKLWPKDFEIRVLVTSEYVVNGKIVWRFDHYTLDTAISKNNPITFKMDKDYTLTAYYTATANISGKVTESLLFGLIKRPSTGAKVSIDTVKTTSTANGTYNLTDIPLGTYTVTVSKPWFETRTKTISLTEPGKTYTLDFEIPLSKWINMMAITAPIFAGMIILTKPKKPSS